MFFSHVIRVTYPHGHSVRPIRIYTLKNPIFESGRFLILFKLANTDLMPIFDKKYSTVLSRKFRGVTDDGKDSEAKKKEQPLWSNIS